MTTQADAQHRYEMSLKKDALFINLSSDDVTFISRQMDQWFRILLDDSYIPTPSLGRQAPPIAATVPVVTPPPVASTGSESVPTAPVAEPSIPAPIAMPTSAPVPVAPMPATPIPDPASEAVYSPPAGIEATPPLPATAMPTPSAFAPPNPTAQPVMPESMPRVAVTSPDPSQSLASNVQDNFDAVMDSVMRDLENNPDSGAFRFDEPMPVAGSLPDQPIGTLPVSSSPDVYSSLSLLCERAQAENVHDFLLLAAFYLTNYEQQPTFSLKRLNSALVKTGQPPVNHSVLEAALSRGILAMVPDLSGTADVSEYRLTPEGEQAAGTLLM